MATPEGRVKARIRAVLKKFGVWFYSPVSNGMGVHGIPDFVCVHNGRSLMVEAKAGGKQPTERQAVQIEAIRRAGGTVFIVNDETGTTELEAWLQEVANA